MIAQLGGKQDTGHGRGDSHGVDGTEVHRKGRAVLLLGEVWLRLTGVSCRPLAASWCTLGSSGAGLVIDEAVSEV